MPHAPEFLSNALGPTIDVAIIDNLNMMRDILKYDTGRGEGTRGAAIREAAITQRYDHEVCHPVVKAQEVRLQSSEGEMTGRIEELQKRIEELESKEHFLVKQIEEEERERSEKRRAFKEEEEWGRRPCKEEDEGSHRSEKRRASKEKEERDRSEPRKSYRGEEERGRSERRKSHKDEEREKSEKRKIYKEEEETEKSEKRKAYKEEEEREKSEKRKTHKDEEEREKSEKRKAYKEEEEREKLEKRKAYKEEEERERTEKRKPYKGEEDRESTGRRKSHKQEEERLEKKSSLKDVEERDRQEKRKQSKEEDKRQMPGTPSKKQSLQDSRPESVCDCHDSCRFEHPECMRQERPDDAIYNRYQDQVSRQSAHGGSKHSVHGGSKHSVHGGSKLSVHGGSKQTSRGASRQNLSEAPSRYDRPEASFCSRYDALISAASEPKKLDRTEPSLSSRYDAVIPEHQHPEMKNQERQERSPSSRYDAVIPQEHPEAKKQDRKEASFCSRYDALINAASEMKKPDRTEVSLSSRYEVVIPQEHPEIKKPDRKEASFCSRYDALINAASETNRQVEVVRSDRPGTPRQDDTDTLRFYIERSETPSKIAPEKNLGSAKSHCDSSLMDCGTNTVGWETAPVPCEAGSGKCDVSMGPCESSLRQCDGNMRICQNSLRQCEGNLKICESNMRSFGPTDSANVRQCESMLKEWESKYEILRARVASEEEKLAHLKAQCDTYKKELAGAKHKDPSKPPPHPPPGGTSQTQEPQDNQCLLDAWDVFASRACHTKLPSFSRTAALERKQFKPHSQAMGKLHCCFPSLMAAGPDHSKKGRCRNEGDAGHFYGSQSELNLNRDHVCDSPSKVQSKIKSGDIQFPIQRDIQCGLHQLLKNCVCSSKQGPKSPASIRSEEELRRRPESSQKASQKASSFTNAPVVDTPPKHRLSRKQSEKKLACRSKSDTAVRRDKNTKIVKVMWAITRINVFQNNFRTYEIMDATPHPPPSVPVKTEGIFVVKGPQKKSSRSPSRRKYNTGH